MSGNAQENPSVRGKLPVKEKERGEIRRKLSSIFLFRAHRVFWKIIPAMRMKDHSFLIQKRSEDGDHFRKRHIISKEEYP